MGPTVLKGSHPITVPAYRDLACVLDEVLQRWAYERAQDCNTPPATECPKRCGNHACIEVVITDFLQVLAGQILTSGRSPEAEAAYIAEVPRLWPGIVATLRAAISQPQTGIRPS